MQKAEEDVSMKGQLQIDNVERVEIINTEWKHN